MKNNSAPVFLPPGRALSQSWQLSA